MAAMNSYFASLYADAAGNLRPDARGAMAAAALRWWRRLRRAALGLWHAGRTAGTAPEGGAAPLSIAPAMSFNKRRFAACTIGAMAIVQALLAAATSDTLRRQAPAELSELSWRTERLLDDFGVELDMLARQPEVEALASSGSAGGAASRPRCPQALTERLVRASLASPLMAEYRVEKARAGFACGPFGAIATTDVSIDLANTGLTLSPVRSKASRMMVVHAAPNGSRAIAELDLLAIAGALMPQPPAVAMQLRSAHGYRLIDTRAANDHGAALWSLSSRSSAHGFVLHADVQPSHLFDAWWRHAPQVALFTLLLLAGVAALAWRRALMRTHSLARIEQALRKRQFEPFVQPIVDLASGECVGAEVLMRWAHPVRGILAPAEFIDEAERSGLIVAMSDLLMSKASERLAPIARRDPRLYFSFNVTPAQLRMPGFERRLATLFDDASLVRGQVMLELTERDVIDAAAQRSLTHFRQAGWAVAIDDFGTGQSALAMLETMSVDRIKIDREFVRTIDQQTVNRPVLDAIINLAQQLGTPLIAEGVETTSQWDYLAARGVQYAQGFLIGKPMPIDEFARWLHTRGSQAATALAAPATPAAPRPDDPWVPNDLLALAAQMRSGGGVDVRDRMFRLQRYRRCFVGSEAVDWLIRQRRLTRPQAVRLGRRLIAHGLIRHVVDEHDFEDDALFYTWCEASDAATETAMPDAGELRAALCAADGPPLAEHHRALVTHHRCATGREIGDWIAARYGVDPATATQWASHLMRRGALRHVFDAKPFVADRTLYRPA